MSQPTLTGHLYLRNHKVLVVDDEPLNVEVFQYNFGNDFALRTATSADEALQILRTEDIAVVVADHRMPGMTGLDLLSWLAEHQPRVVRILLTAHTHVDLLLEAVNRGVLFRYVPKPWDADGMRQDMMLAIQRHRMERDAERLRRQAVAEARVEGARLVASAVEADLSNALGRFGGLAHDEGDRAVVRQLDRIAGLLRQNAGSQGAAVAPASLSQLAAQACDLAAENAEELGIEVRRGFAPGLADVVVDSAQAVDAIAALVQNALQAASAVGGTTITVATEQSGAAVRVTVTDPGAGPGADAASLFLPFVTSRPGAAGLGLALVRALCLAHGGRYDLVHAPEGTRAWLELPARS